MGLMPDEFYGDDTAMLYDPASDIAFVESTVRGMEPRAVGDYFAEFADPDTDYVLMPRLDAEATAKARGFQTIRKLAMGPVTDVDRESGVGLIKGLGERFDAGTIDIEIKAQRERGRSLSPSSGFSNSAVVEALGRTYADPSHPHSYPYGPYRIPGTR